MTEKRRRGRPIGTGKNDAPFLAEIADTLVRTPGLKATAAMRPIVNTRKDWVAASPEAMIRRLQAKWKVEGAKELLAARERAAPKAAPRLSYLSSAGIPNQVAELQRQIGALNAIKSPLLDQAEEIRRQIDTARSHFAKFGVLEAALVEQATYAFRNFEEARNRAFGVGKGVLDEIDSAKRQVEVIRNHFGALGALQRTLAEQAAAARGGLDVRLLAVRTALGLT
ncbi:hypothetical protein NKH53_18460 [Mesorhizobium australicum]|uniref:hypothetical protein n=1 Tax=Mesorhizobium australicum TaxID=536018 RepID=UPI0033371E31